MDSKLQKFNQSALADLAVKTQRFVASSKARNTIRAYKSDWKHFSSWCDRNDLQSFPAAPETVALYISDLAGIRAVSTIRRRLTAINKVHGLANMSSPAKHPLVQEVFDGIRREHGTLQRGKAPLLSDDVRAMIRSLSGSDTAVARDKAILLIGFAGCFRRSEIVAIDVEDLAFATEGLVVLMRSSKTDQRGEGFKKAIPYGASSETCPVRALQEWLTVSAVKSGPAFRPLTKSQRVRDRRLTDRSVALIVKKAALAAGLDPSAYAGHSLRSGLATQAAAQGVSERSIMRQGGWKSASMARRYIRDGSLFRDNAAGQVGL